MSTYTAVFPVGSRTCTLIATARPNVPNDILASLQVQWLPDTPVSFSASERAQFVNGRENFLAGLSNALAPMSIRVEL